MSSTTPITNTSFFRPTGISGCALWLDAADSASVVLSGGSNVTQWRDKSGSNNNAIQLTSSNMPAYLNIPAISQNAIYFPSNSTNLTTINSNSTSGNSSRTIFVITYLPNSSSRARIGTGTHATNTPPSAFGLDQAPSISQLYAPYLYTASDNILSASLTGLQCIYAYYDSGVSQIGGGYRFNTFLTKNTTLNTTASPWYFGLRPDNSGSLTSYICEFLQYNRTLTTGQRQQVEGYLSWKWGLQRSLPVNHPYYNNPQQSIYPYTQLTTVPQPQTNFPSWSFFSPRSIPSCSLWLDAADSASVVRSNASNITQWNDKSGNGQNFTLAGATNPVLLSNIQNGQSVIRFNGTSQTLNNTTMLFPSSAYTVFSLQLLTSGSGFQRVINSDPNFFIGVNGTIVAIFTGSNGAWNDIGALTPNYNNSNRWALTSTYSAPSGSSNALFNFINGTQYNTKNGTTGSFTGLIIGGLPNTQYWNGYFAEFLVYSRVLSAGERQRVEGYLALKWGLLSTLPTAHPTKANFFYPILPALPAVTQSVVPASINTNGRFIPTSLSGLALWLDAADSTTIQFSSGANISNWRDKSGNERNATQGTTINQPSIGSRSVVFDTNKLLTTTYTSFPPSETIFIVLNVFSATNGVEGQLLQTSAVGGRQFGLNALRLVTAKSGVGYLIGIGAGGTLTSNTPTLVGSTNDGSQIFHYINGSVTGTNLSITPYSGTGTTLIGNTSGRNTGLVGYINEILTYSNTLSVNQRQQVEGYLAWKWGIRSSLPSTHPNYYIPVS